MTNAIATNKAKLLLIIAMSACVAMIFLDESGVGVTLPSIQKDLGLSNLGMQWVMNAFLLLLSSFLLASGRLADSIGHRKVFIIGMIVFLVASFLCGVAQSQAWLITGRVLQGIGASLLAPTNMTLINMAFPAAERGKALGTVIGISSLFMAGGPLIGGFIAEFFSWRWIFLLNIPVAIISIYFTLLAIPADKALQQSFRFDIKGLIFFSVVLNALIIGLMEGTNFGWQNPIIISLLLIGTIGLVLFAYFELKISHPLIDLRCFSNKVFLTGNIILFCGQLSVISMIFWSIWLQQVIGFTPLMAGIALLPTTGPIIFFARIGGKWLDQYGPRLPIILGTGLIVLGTFWIALMAQQNSYLWIIFGLLCCGIGTPLIMPTAVTTILSTVAPAQHGMAAGTLNTMRQIGAAFGLAIIGATISYYEMPANNLLPTNTTAIYSRAFAYGIAVSGIFALLAFIFSVLYLPKKLNFISESKNFH